MTVALLLLGTLVAIATLAAIQKLPGLVPAVGLALLAAGVWLVAFGLWLNGFFIQAVKALIRNIGESDGQDIYQDTYYVVVHGRYAITSGIVLLVLSAVAFWLHRKAAPTVWVIARLAFWVCFGLIAAELIVITQLFSTPYMSDPAEYLTINRISAILATASFVAFATIALCALHTLWHSFFQRS